ncbi:DUF1080 domain-containing protein [Parafilimonas sp.]|uniref:3-keto-disaccharide hydrolase n=1 Tax=Parafilimonas sp. TaxID=1969739 RepID=UPI0039E28B19
MVAITKNAKFPVSLYGFAMLAIAFIISGCHSANSNSNAESTAQGLPDSAGFVSLFDGSTLSGWEGDTAVWHVADGAIVGEVTPASTPLKSNTFLIWKDGKPGNFELTAEYEISAEGNSGIQYRSEEVEGVPFGLRGYQMDIDGANTYTGQNYEERARCIVAFRGQKVTLPLVTDSISKLAKNNVWSVAVINDSLGNPDSLKAKINSGWNSCRIVAKGNHLQHYINGVLMCDVTDDDTANRKADGLIGLQMHAGHIMRVAYRNIKLKELK